MALLNNDNTNKEIEMDDSVIEDKKQDQLLDNSVASKENISSDNDGVNILDLDAELQKEKAKAGISDDIPVENNNKSPMRPGLGMVGDPNKRAGVAKAPVPKQVKEDAGSMGGGLGAFSLLPLDEEGILYHDLPRAIRKLLYVLVAGAIIILGIWYFASDFLAKYMTEANLLQGDIRTVNAEQIRYQVTDADLRVNYQYYQLVKNLLYNHVTWSKFFAFLEQFTVPEVYYTNFSVNAVVDDYIVFDAVALNLQSGLKQYLVLQKYATDYCDEVEMTGLNLVSGEDDNEQSVTFNLRFKIKPSIFKLKTKENN